MNEIRRVLKAAAWRLWLIDFFRVLAVTLTGAVVAMIAVRIVQQVFGLDITWPQGWGRLFAGAAGAAVVGALMWTLIRRARTVAVARALDERANLKESLSTALCVAKSEDPWAKVVVETARQKAVSVQVRQAIPITAPRLWPVPFAAALTLAIVWWSVPTIDVLGLFKKRQAIQQQDQEIKEVKSELKLDEKKLDELLQKAKVDLKDEKAGEPGENKPQTPDEIRRAAVKKLTAMTDKLNEMKNGDKPQELQALKETMKQLKQPGPGPLDELSKSLQQGNFSKAQQELEQLQQKMASSDMKPEDKEKAAQQMQKLAEQLKQLAEKKDDLEKALEKAGMTKEQAKQASQNAESLQKALQQMQNMSEEQKQQLQKMAQSQMQAAKQCNSMSQSMSKMAKGAGKSGMSQEGQKGMESLQGQLSEMEMMSKECESLDAASKEAMNQLAKMCSQCNGNCNGDGELRYKECNGPWKAGETNNRGGGRGGPGQSGGSPRGNEQDTGVNIAKTMAPSKLGQGPIIGSRYVNGDTIKGESVKEFEAAVEAGSKSATEAIDTQQVPRELQDTVKHYFGRLKARVEPTGGPPATEAPAAPASGSDKK